jgi:hypothetical protein
MRGLLSGLFALLIGVPAFAQQATVPATARVCVAQLRNQTANKFDVVKLRQLLMDSLKQTKPAKAGTITVVPIEVSEADDAQAAVQAQECQFAVYTRLLQQAPPQSAAQGNEGITYRSANSEPTQHVMGVQCTVERAGSGIPALIDRQYTKFPVVPQNGVEKLLSAESERIAEAVEKKLSSTPK